MPKLADPVDELLKALADPTRRQVVEQLTDGPASTSTLAEPFDMALPSFTQHLSVLERAGVITSTKQGRTRTFRLLPSRLDELATWLAEQRLVWEQRLDQFDQFVINQQEQQ